MSNPMLEAVLLAVIASDECGQTIEGKRLPCEWEKCECRKHANAAVRTTIDYLLANISIHQVATGWQQLRRAHLPKLGPGPCMVEAYKAMLTQCKLELETTP